MSSFNARSATEALLPWSPIWFDVNAFANLSMIIRWIRMSSVYLTHVGRPRESLKTGRTVHHLLRMTQPMLEDQGVFKILEDGKNRASSVANDPTHVGRSVLVRLKRAVTKLVRLKCLRLKSIFFLNSSEFESKFFSNRFGSCDKPHQSSPSQFA